MEAEELKYKRLLFLLYDFGHYSWQVFCVNRLIFHVQVTFISGCLMDRGQSSRLFYSLATGLAESFKNRDNRSSRLLSG